MKVHADIPTGLEHKQLGPQNPEAGSLGQSWDTNTGLLEHSPMVYTLNVVCCHCKTKDSIPLLFEDKTLQIRISHSEKR